MAGIRLADKLLTSAVDSRNNVPYLFHVRNMFFLAVVAPWCRPY